MKVLILTKNITAEQKLQERLQYLGHEVFCTQQSVADFTNPLYTKVLFNIFESVVISETISQRESVETIRFFNQKKYDITILRKVEQLHEELEAEEVESLHTEAPIEELREKFQERQRVGQDFEQAEKLFFSNVEFERLNFSKNERKVIEALYESPGKCVARNTLCEYLWRAGATNSNLSQMSVLINKIKEKCKRADISENAIKTIWGQGYTIDRQFSSFLAERHFFEKAN